MHYHTAQSFYINYTVAPEAAQNIIIVRVARAHVYMHERACVVIKKKKKLSTTNFH